MTVEEQVKTIVAAVKAEQWDLLATQYDEQQLIKIGDITDARDESEWSELIKLCIFERHAFCNMCGQIGYDCLCDRDWM